MLCVDVHCVNGNHCEADLLPSGWGYATTTTNRRASGASAPRFLSYEEELDLRLEHDPSPTESDLILDLESSFDDDFDFEPLDYNRRQQERSGFVARSASFNGPNGAFAPYRHEEALLPKRSRSFCETTKQTKKQLIRQEEIETSDPEESLKKREGSKKRRRVRREKFVEKSEKSTLSVRRLSDSVQLKEVKEFERKDGKESKPKQRVKQEPPPVSIRRKLPPVPVNRNLVIVPTLEVGKPEVASYKGAKPVSIPKVPGTFSKPKISEAPQVFLGTSTDATPVKVNTEKEKPPPVEEKKHIVSVLQFQVKAPIQDEEKKEFPEDSESDFLSPISETTEPPPLRVSQSSVFRSGVQSPKGALEVLFEKGLQEIQRKSCEFPDNEPGTDNPFREQSPIVFHRKASKLRVKVGFDSPTIGQDLSTPPTEINTEDKTLPYFLKSQLKSVDIPKPPIKSQRVESNIEYEKSVELGKKLISVSEPNGRKTPVKTEVSIEEEDSDELIEDVKPAKPRKAELKLKIKQPKPDFSNEIREEIEPITPDTDQSELEDLLETFSKEVKQSDIEDILSGDESRRSRTPRTFLETAFLSSPIPQSVKMSDGPINNRHSSPARSGRVSAPLFRDGSSPDFVGGRQSVPVDYARAIRSRSLSREGYHTLQNARTPSRNPAIPKKDIYSPSEIEAVFWERLKQKKIRAALREQELLRSNGSPVKNGNAPFLRSSPQRSTIGPIFQREYENFPPVQMRKAANGVKSPESPVPRSQSAMDFTKKKDDKGLISKIPFFRRRSKSSGKEDSYQKASEDATDDPTPITNRGSLISTASSTDSMDQQPLSPKKVSFDGWAQKNGESSPSRPLPPVPQTSIDAAGYGVILRRKHESLEPVYGRSGSGMSVIRENESVYGVARASVPRPTHLPIRDNPVRSARPLHLVSDTESGSEAGEVQRIFMGTRIKDEEWGEGKGRGLPPEAGGPIRDEDLRRLGRPGNRRDDPRRHTLASAHHQSASLARSMDLEMSSKAPRRKSPLPRGYPPPSSAMLYDDDPGIMSEAETSSTGFRRGGKQRSSLPVVRTPSKTLERPLGPGLPVKPLTLMVPHAEYLARVGDGSMTGPGGLVFLQYRNETKRALLPNEITSIDTVKALFVRSFPKQLTMEYLDSPHVRIYIHDSNKDMFYELEDLRSHLRDIRDRTVLRLFETAEVNGGAGGAIPGGPGLLSAPSWDQDQSYFSEPEFDSEYQHQHIHKSKEEEEEVETFSQTSGTDDESSKSGSGPYYMTHSFPPSQGGASTASLPRSSSLLRAYSPAVPPVKGVVPADRLHAESGYMSSPERGSRGYGPPYNQPGPPYEDPYYAQYGSRTGSITPVIDEEASDTEVVDEAYHLYGARGSARNSAFPAAAPPYDATRLRVEHMERQLANLTGLVQKALTQTPPPSSTGRDYLAVPGYRGIADDFDKNSSSSSASLPDEAYIRSDVKPPKLGKDKSVSFEKSVSFSDEPPDMNSPKQHSPLHAADTKPAKSAIKSSTLPRTSSQERDRHKPPPPPKPVSLSPGQYDNRMAESRAVYHDLQLTPEMYNQLRGLQKKAKDLRQEMRNLRRMSQAQAHAVREAIAYTFINIRAMLLSGGESNWSIDGDKERLRLSREEELYKQEMLRLEKDLTELESTVEELRGNVINRKTRVNMSDVEDMALVLSKSSKTVADLKVRFPGLQDGIRTVLTSEKDLVVREEKFLKEEPERLESALRRCKKLTGTLVTLKRLASVQEQRLPSTGDPRLSPPPADVSPVTTPGIGQAKSGVGIPAGGVVAPSGGDDIASQRPENALDALLDELQTFARPPGRKGSVDSNPPTQGGSLRRLHSYPSSSDESSPPVPAKPTAAPRRVPPPPPPRTSSRSPLASPTSVAPSSPRSQPQMGVQTGTLRRSAPGRSSLREPRRASEPAAPGALTLPLASASNSSSCESVNSQEGAKGGKDKESRKEILEQRHQELLRKQKALQEQYARLQQLQRGTAALTIPTPDQMVLKKTGSESNLLAKMGLGQSLSAAATMSGSLTHLAPHNQAPLAPLSLPAHSLATSATPSSVAATTKVYETDIL